MTKMEIVIGAECVTELNVDQLIKSRWVTAIFMLLFNSTVGRGVLFGHRW
jgi:hypothetical protein